MSTEYNKVGFPVPEINHDELIGYIMRKAEEADLRYQLSYEETNFILETELEFLKKKGIAK